MSDLKVVVTNKNVNVEKLKTIATVCQYEGEDVMPRDLLLNWGRDADAIFCLLTDRIDVELLNACPKLKVIGTMSAGHDHIDLEACKQRDVKVGYTPNVLSESTAELGIALLLATSRRIVEASHSAKSGGWTNWNPSYMIGKGLSQSTCGIYGLGQIGSSVARKLEAFNPSRIIYHNRRQRIDVTYDYVDFNTLLKESDFLVVTASATPENENIFDTEAFKKMKNDAVFCNISRGSLVNTNDLYNALKDGEIGAAGIDVCSPEPLPTSHPLHQTNCVILPHIGSATRSTRDLMASLTVDNIYNVLKGQKMAAALHE
ncbi:Glyoxylate reductase/hydroxypyruvate reductase [Aphelenchoides besseyi]|nr:Glyoxylate reductase/hydroxypyruvate reductase [Aphelenchoides besseyi]KAI6200879.1 Glyoxylate reductase/hydroxypyruvate reductase [Aphelenchoides besseyi]